MRHRVSVRARAARAAIAMLVMLAAAPHPAALAQDFPITEPAPTPILTPAPVVPKRRPPAPPPTPAVAPEPSDAYDPADPYAYGPPALIALIGPPALEDLPSEATAVPAQPAFGPIELLGETVATGSRAELRWRVGTSFDGGAVTTPVTVVHGSLPGPKLCLTAAVHGDELNGVEVVRRIANDIDPATLSGTVIAVPVVNLMGFSRGTRYLPDRRDLNRFFPGSPYGSAASRIAFSLFKSVVQYCDAVVDFHTGSFDRANLPQVRGDLTLPRVLELTRGFGATPVLHSPGTRGMLRLAATDHGIPAVTFEVGAPLRLEPEQIDFAVEAIQSLMHALGMTRSFRMFSEPQATFYESRWVRANHGGMLFSAVKLGDRVRQGQRLGKVVDALDNTEHEVKSPYRGRVIGMALNQLVLPGFAAYHIGIETSEQQAVEEAQQPAAPEQALERMEGDEMNESRERVESTNPGGEDSGPAILDIGPPAPDESQDAED